VADADEAALDDVVAATGFADLPDLSNAKSVYLGRTLGWLANVRVQGRRWETHAAQWLECGSRQRRGPRLEHEIDTAVPADGPLVSLLRGS
jgi:hypothetical protein